MIEAVATRARRDAAVLAGLVAGTILLLRAPLDVGPRDAGELTAAGWSLGVGHPTGSPFSTILQHLVGLIPLGAVPLRQGVLMVAATALAIGCGVVVTRAGQPRARWPIVAPLVVASVALAPTIMRAGTMTEVYATSLALIAAAWAIVERRDRGASFALGALAGLGAASHVTARLLVPLVAAAHVASAVPRGARRRAVIAALSGFAVTAPLVLYVPAAASRGPALDWGDARTVRGFVRHFFATDIRETFATRTVPSRALDDARALFETTLLDLGAPLLALGIAGLVVTLSRAVRARTLDARAVVAIAILLDSAYAVLVHPMGILDRQVGHVALLGLAILGAWIVAGIEARGRMLAAAALAVGTFAGFAPRAIDELRGPDDRFVPELWTVPGALARVPPRALVVCDSDDACGGAFEAQIVEGARPDVTVVPRSFAEHGSLLSPRLAGVDATIARALSAKDRPLLVQGGGEPYPFFAALDGVAAPLLRPGAPLDPGPRAFALLTARIASICGPALDACPPLTRGLLAQSAIGPAHALLAAGRFAEADALATVGLRLDDGMAALWTNRAVVRATVGRLEDALRDAERAVALDPTRVPALANLATYQAQLGRVDDARATTARLTAACTRCLAGRLLSAALDVRGGAPSEVLDALGPEALAKGRKEAWCRAYAVAAVAPPPSCAVR